MSGMSVSVMNVFGLATVQNGTGIFSAPNPTVNKAAGDLFRVDVADPCSGIRSLFALMMISAIYANFALKSPWKRIVLILSAVPLAIAGNLVRILLLTLGIVSLGAPTAIGTMEEPTWFHEGAGFAVFLVALGGMLVVCGLLNSRAADWRHKWKSFSTPPETPDQPPGKPKPPADIY
jgi:exosortase/archaeosortase family protein